MARKVKEWIGKTDDAKIPQSTMDRIMRRQNDKCAISGAALGPGNRPEFDHKTPLWLGGEHRESNLQAISKDEHAKKTSAEATIRAKVNNQRRKHVGITMPKKSIQGPGFAQTGRKPLFDKSALPKLGPSSLARQVKQ